MCSSHLGMGEQHYEPGAVTLGAVGPMADRWGNRGWGMQASGCATSIAANGDQLRIEFILYAFLIDETRLCYTGEYWVVQGGTGRFDYPAGDADLGSGLILGKATMLDGGALEFSHTFVGTLAMVSRSAAPK